MTPRSLIFTGGKDQIATIKENYPLLRLNSLTKNMDKVYDHKTAESKWYQFWEDEGFFKPEINPEGKPYTIVLPLPNASGKMHTGNVLMIAIEDLLVRWHRMKGDATLWIPGTDHAGTETQITFERQLKKEGKSRFGFDRETLYQNIYQFVMENKHLIESQIRAMGASVDWSRYMFTLDPESIDTVYNTFIKMSEDGLIYKDDYMVNYCPTCGTTYADIEIDNEEAQRKLYFVKYQVESSDQYITITTTRPETIFADTGIAIYPRHPKYSKFAGLNVINPLTGATIPVFEDKRVVKEFGTGALKITPAHDPLDYEIGKENGLDILNSIDLNGRMTKLARELEGIKVAEAREKSASKLQELGALEKIEDYKNSVPVCKAGHIIEPMVLPNWFVKVQRLKEPAHQAVKNGKVKIYPKWREVTYHRWMENMHDWAISRQNVWGIRIPAWYDVHNNPLLQVTFLNTNKEIVTGTISDLMKDYSLDEITQGLQKVIAPSECIYQISKTSPGKDFLQETDTFDTWYSSGQWPLITLGFPNGEDFKKFYPTDVMETAWEILSKWVSRMIMFGIYLTGEAPFHSVYLHGVVKALDGKKMSKSLGNVINPEEYIQDFGTDALRMGLVLGNGNCHDFAFPKDKVIAIKHFNNKIWNMTRFVLMMIENDNIKISPLDQITSLISQEDQAFLDLLNKTIVSVNQDLEKFRLADAGEKIYQFMWHEIADKYIESVKNREDKEIALSVLVYILKTSLELLHPFMPFITEELWQKLPHEGKSIMIASWPTVSQK